MIKRLQKKFVLIAMCSFLAVIVCIIGGINIAVTIHENEAAENILNILSDNDGKFPKDDIHVRHDNFERKKPLFDFNMMTEETPFETRFFTVMVDSYNNIIQIDTGHIAAVTSEDAQEIALELLDSGSTSGNYGSYKYRITEKSYGKLMVFVDRSNRQQTLSTYFIWSCSIGAISLLIVFILVSLLSRRAIKPVIENMEKQKQFITDAGHEIKTPLAIISANVDVLELDTGKSEWTDSIRNQTKRLNRLVKSLLELSKVDEGKSELKMCMFSISDTVEHTVEDFQPIAKKLGKTLVTEITPQLSIKGDCESISRLTGILVDNALKYSDENGTITVSLSRNSKGTILAVKNTGCTLKQNELSRLFDRFYRADSSRSRETGGYGIGLSLAKAITEAHKGKISAKADNGIITFRVIL